MKFISALLKNVLSKRKEETETTTTTVRIKTFAEQVYDALNTSVPGLEVYIPTEFYTGKEIAEKIYGIDEDCDIKIISYGDKSALVVHKYSFDLYEEEMNNFYLFMVLNGMHN